jgi:chemotaxis protein methyltransferase CheR
MEMNDQEYGLLKVKLLDLVGVDLNFYKEAQMRRRLGNYLSINAGGDTAGFLAEVKRDTEKRDALKDFITINVSEFYRDPEQWESFRKLVMSRFKPGTPVQVWSAGCSIGAEAYTLAMLFAEAGLDIRITGTDIDDGVLARATAGGPYGRSDLRSLPEALRKKYFTTTDAGEFVIPSLKQNVQFKKHDLLKDRYGTNYDIVLCRNVIIYFTDEAKLEIFKGFRDSLKPTGSLFIGATEAILAASSLGLRRASGCIYDAAPVVESPVIHSASTAKAR